MWVLAGYREEMPDDTGDSSLIWIQVISLKSEVKVPQSCPTLQPIRLYGPWNSLGQNTGVGSLSLLDGIFQTQGSNPGLTHCRQILYQLSKGSPRILNWVACPFSSGSGFPTLESNQGLLHCRRILHQLRYQGSQISLKASYLLYDYPKESSQD